MASMLIPEGLNWKQPGMASLHRKEADVHLELLSGNLKTYSDQGVNFSTDEIL